MIPPFHWWRTVFFLIPAIGVYDRVGHVVDRVEPVRAQRSLRALVCAHVVAADSGDDRCSSRGDGLDRLEPGRTYVFVSNHQSIYDIPILFWSLPYQLRIIAKESLGNVPFLGWHLRRTGHMLVDRRRQTDRGSSDGRRASCRTVLSPIIFPSARAAAMAASRNSRAGSFFLALQAGLPIVPLSIVGSRHVMLKGRRPYPGRRAARRPRPDRHP